MTGPPDPTEPLPMIPPRLAADVRALHEASDPPEHVNRLVLLRARRELEAAEVRRRNRFRLQRLVAAAAAVALFVLVARLVSVKPTLPPPTAPTPPTGRAGGSLLGAEARAYDVTGDGRVNILDAFRLARLLESPSPGPGPAWGGDANGDGTVNRADVDAIAMRAVRLEGAG